MSNLHPIFEDIFKTMIEPKKQEETEVPFASAIMDYFNQDVDFDNLEILRGFINEVKNNPNDVIRVISQETDKLEEELVENGVCPLCGNKLTFEHDESLDTYVPYGSTTVKESSGGQMVCDCCGYRSEQ